MNKMTSLTRSFYQLFYYERISIEGPAVSSPYITPCLSSWGEVEIMEREKREKELGGYGSGKVYTYLLSMHSSIVRE